MDLISQCICNNTDFSKDVHNGLNIRICKRCGVIHHNPDMGKESLLKFYRDSYHTDYMKETGCQTYPDRYSHDLDLASKRYSNYLRYLAQAGISTTGNVLDIGSSNGAFVDYLRKLGYNACGVDVTCIPHKYTYQGVLKDIAFPTESFDLITLHDVLEHLVDPAEYLTEIQRILKPNGLLIIDFPNYFEEAGKHHWKKLQHLWYFNKEQMSQILNKYGISVLNIEKPIPSKLVYYGKKLKSIVSNKKILVLPGIGDIYWVFVKLQKFIAQEKLGIPQVYIWNFDGRPRSLEFVSRVPFVKAAGYFTSPVFQPEFDEVYHKVGRTVVRDYHGFDYLISANGVLRNGLSLDDTRVISDESDWYHPFHISLSDIHAANEYKDLYGDYVLGFFSELAMFRNWVSKVTVPRIVKLYSQITTKDQKVLLTGCEWDIPFNESIMKVGDKNKFVNLCGKTSFSQLIGLMLNAKLFLGFCGGNTIFATRLKLLTTMFWSNYFHDKRFFTSCCPPDSLNRWYFPYTVEEIDFNKISSDPWVSLLK